ncbi:MAG: thioredoxin family protein [Gammaproteobacteria bacterium]|nr:thioredoxin family protein [Gammaproteobacteria bacterium]
MTANNEHIFVPLDEFDFHHRLTTTPGPALVIFTGEGCASCRAWKQLLAAYRLRYSDLTLFEVDAGQAQALTREFEVFHLPALFLFRDGQFHGALATEARLDTLHAAIQANLAAPPQEAP